MTVKSPDVSLAGDFDATSITHRCDMRMSPSYVLGSSRRRALASASRLSESVVM
jgi:hypothetical protein